MSRHGYSDDWCGSAEEQWAGIRHRGAVTSAFRGRKGQAFFREMLAALDAMPDKRLIAGALVDADGCACALGAVALARHLEVSVPDPDTDPEDFWEEEMPDLGVADAMAREIMYYNDEVGPPNETPEQRWARMRRWTARQIIEWEKHT